jgi:hypothetical protein
MLSDGVHEPTSSGSDTTLSLPIKPGGMFSLPLRIRDIKTTGSHHVVT